MLNNAEIIKTQQIFCMNGVDDFIFGSILQSVEWREIHTSLYRRRCLSGQHCAGHLVMMVFVTLISRPLYILNFLLITPNYPLYHPIFSSLCRYFQSTTLDLVVWQGWQHWSPWFYTIQLKSGPQLLLSYNYTAGGFNWSWIRVYLTVYSIWKPLIPWL